MVEKDSPTTNPVVVNEREKNVEEGMVEKDKEAKVNFAELEKEETLKKRCRKEQIEEDPPNYPLPARYPQRLRKHT